MSAFQIVCDDGEPPLSASATLQVSVTDVNDNAPQLLLNEYHVSTSLDAEAGFL